MNYNVANANIGAHFITFDETVLRDIRWNMYWNYSKQNQNSFESQIGEMLTIKTA